MRPRRQQARRQHRTAENRARLVVPLSMIVDGQLPPTRGALRSIVRVSFTCAIRAAG
jgi:hypothetical protein